MKKKNTNIEKTSNRDILKNKIIQLNEAVFVKKMDLQGLHFYSPSIMDRNTSLRRDYFFFYNY